MNGLRRLSVAALALTYLQLVFGGIVRVTGSGMGCGDNWPKCNGSWIPPFSDPTVMIEWTHRLLASLVVITIAAFFWFARRESAAGTPGARPVAGAARGALILVIVVALVGAVTVKLGNVREATVAHWMLALSLLGTLVAGAVKSGAIGGASALAQGGTPRAMRSLWAGVMLAFVAVVLGGVVAKTPGASTACWSLPVCGVLDEQTFHRVFAYLLLLHVAFVTIAIRRRADESLMVQRAATIATSLVFLQAGLGAAMIMSTLAPALRIIHQATGVAVWVAMYWASTLARTAAGQRQMDAQVQRA